MKLVFGHRQRKSKAKSKKNRKRGKTGLNRSKTGLNADKLINNLFNVRYQSATSLQEYDKDKQVHYRNTTKIVATGIHKKIDKFTTEIQKLMLQKYDLNIKDW